jgi:ABC-type sugar transport system ATPase subunit
MDEPTRGVDVGAKLEISNLIKELAREGTATLLITSEVEEMVSLADRVLVLREGGIIADLDGAGINNATLMELSLGAETLQ